MSAPKRIGDRLVAANRITRADAEAAAVETVLKDTRLVSILVKGGKLSDVEGLRALSEQVGVPGVDLLRISVAPEVLAKVSVSQAIERLVVPLVVEGPNLMLAMASPQEQAVIDEIAFATGLKVFPLVALHFRLVEVARAYPAEGQAFRAAQGPEAPMQGSPALPLVQAELPPPPQQPELVEKGRIEIGEEDEPLVLTDLLPEGPKPAVDSPSGPAPVAATTVKAPPATAEIPTAPASRGAEALATNAADAEIPANATASVPPQAEASAAAAPDASPQVSATPRKILVVDDEPEILQLVVEALKPAGHEIITATRGVEALHLIKSGKPDLIVLDAMLPEVHGFEICRKVKESKRFANTPVLMISAIYRGWRMVEDIKALYKADAFLEKPFRIKELRRQVEGLLAADNGAGEESPASEKAERAYAAAVAAVKGNDLEAAFANLRQAETLDPFAAKTQALLGRVLEAQERVFQAIYHYERAVELDPDLFSAIKSLALLYQAQGFRNKAIEMWERSLRAAPSPEVRDQIKQHLVSIL